MESPVSQTQVARADGLPSNPFAVSRAFSLGMLLLLVVGVLTYAVLNFGLTRFEDADARRVKERQKILADRLGDDAKWLNDAPSWFSKDKQIVRVPIKEAMRMTASELAAIAPHSADPITATPPAAASPAPAPAATAAPTPAAGAPAPLPGTTPAPAPSPAPAAGDPAAKSAPLASPAPPAAPAPAGSTPAPNPTDPGASPSNR